MAIKTKPSERPYDLQLRINTILDQIWPHLEDVEHVVLEGHGYHAASGTDTRSVELVGVLKFQLCQAEVHFQLRTPGEIKKLATGKGNASKRDMQVAAGAAGFEPGLKNHNLADAYFLALSAWA